MTDKNMVVIPARMGSTRFPGKVLVDLGGRPVIQWVYERAVESGADDVVVATDDQRVLDTVIGFGGKAAMTSPDHVSGTDRVWEVAKESQAEVIVNVQGDEPFIPSVEIKRLIELASEKREADICTIAVRAEREEVENDPNIVKVVMASDGFALYFSRSMIPFLRAGGEDVDVYRHWGVYAFRRAALERFVSLPPGGIENCEKLEQLRALENGMRILVMRSDEQVIGIDTPEDLKMAEKRLAELA